jgi:hypothetical protein
LPTQVLDDELRQVHRAACAVRLRLGNMNSPAT